MTQQRNQPTDETMIYVYPTGDGESIRAWATLPWSYPSVPGPYRSDSIPRKHTHPKGHGSGVAVPTQYVLCVPASKVTTLRP